MGGREDLSLSAPPKNTNPVPRPCTPPRLPALGGPRLYFVSFIPMLLKFWPVNSTHDYPSSAPFMGISLHTETSVSVTLLRRERECRSRRIGPHRLDGESRNERRALRRPRQHLLTLHNDSDKFEGDRLGPLVPIREYSRDVRFLPAAVQGPQRSGTMICVRSHGSVSLGRGEQAARAYVSTEKQGTPPWRSLRDPSIQSCRPTTRTVSRPRSRTERPPRRTRRPRRPRGGASTAPPCAGPRLLVPRRSTRCRFLRRRSVRPRR